MKNNNVENLCKDYINNPNDVNFMKIVKELSFLESYFFTFFKVKNFIKKIEFEEFQHVFRIGIFVGIQKMNNNKGNYFTSIFCYTRKELQKFFYSFLLKSKEKYERKEIYLGSLTDLNMVEYNTPEKQYIEKEFKTCLKQVAEQLPGKEKLKRIIDGDTKGIKFNSNSIKILLKKFIGLFKMQEI